MVIPSREQQTCPHKRTALYIIQFELYDLWSHDGRLPPRIKTRVHQPSGFLPDGSGYNVAVAVCFCNCVCASFVFSVAT